MPDSVRATRKNGLSRPYTPAQVSTWIFLPFLVLGFLFCVSPILPLVASIACTIIFCAFAIASVYYAYMAMKIDPSDPRLLNANRTSNTDDNNNQNENGTGCSGSLCHVNPEEPTKQCWICDIQVGEKSMHCKFCNKCVDHFDHHCMWLNTCVGKANYPYFFRIMVCINLMLLVQAAIQIALIVDVYLEFGGTKQRALDWFSLNTTTPVVAIMGVFLLFDLVSLSLIGQLLIFHLKLRNEGISTYQFIVRDNKNRRERTKKESELKNRRQGAIDRAKEEGKGFLVFRLQKGGLLREKCGFRCFDPMSMDDKSGEENNPASNGGETNGGP